MKTTAAALCLALSFAESAGQAQPIVVIPPKWSPLGPTLISNGQAWPGRIPVTGRINVVAPNPKNRLGDVWIGSATGGVWRGSVEPQNFWEPMTDDQASLAVGAIRLDSCTAVRCQTVWVGTGENGIRRDTQHGMGVLRGRWKGNRYEWKLLGESHFARGSITGLVLDPGTPDNAGKRLFVALSSGVTSNASHSTVTTKPAGAYGIWRSDDAGDTWANVLDQGTPATDLEIDPQNPQILFAGLRRKGIYRSTNGGGSWQPIHNGIPANVAAAADWPEIAVHRTPGMAQATLYAVLGACPHPHEKGTPSRCSPAVYKSTNGGASWIQVFAEGSPFTTYGEPLTTYASYAHALTIHPSKPDTLWFGGINLYKSTNGGVSWKTVGNKSLHPDHHQIVVWESSDTATGDKAYNVNDGGFFVGDGENEWDGSYQEGLEVTQFQSISTSGLVEHIIGGTQDNGTNVFQGSSVWSHVNDGDAASTNMDLDAGLNLYDVYVGADPRRCQQADFCPYDWPSITSGIAATNNVSWYPPFVQDGNAIMGGQHPLLFATDHLYRSTDDGSSWTAVTTGAPLGGTGAIAELGGIQNPISAVAVAPSDSNRIYLGYYDGQVFTTANGKSANPSWTRVDTNGLPDRPVTSVAVHPADPLRAFVAFTGFAQHSVYTTPQAGASWAPFDDDNGTGVFAKNPVNVLQIEAKPPHRMWAGTDDGVYSRKSPDAGELWSRTSSGLPRVAVYDFDVSADGKRIYAATHGRGVWTMSTSPIPKIYAAECCGPVDLYDPAPFISIYIAALEPDQRCTMALLERDRVCFEGERDADGATLGTNARGFLVTSKPGHYTQRPLSWACYEGRCAGGVPLSRCNVTDVRVTCGEQSVQSAVKRPVEAADPPSTQLGFLSDPGAAGSGSFILSPLLKKNGGKSEVICSSQVSFSAYESEERVLARAAEAVNASNRCRDAGVRAAVFGSLSPGTREDEGPKPLRLVLEGPRLTGVQLVTELAASGPGAFTVDGYGVPRRDTLVVPRLTLSGTARGGDLRVTERSSLGTCAFAVRTAPGERAEAVAAKVQRAFLAEESRPGKPKPRWLAKLKSLFRGEKGKPSGFRIDPGCLNRQNPRDVSRYGATLRFPLGQELAVSNTDAGLSFTIGSDR